MAVKVAQRHKATTNASRTASFHHITDDKKRNIQYPFCLSAPAILGCRILKKLVE